MGTIARIVLPAAMHWHIAHVKERFGILAILVLLCQVQPWADLQLSQKSKG